VIKKALDECLLKYSVRENFLCMYSEKIKKMLNNEEIEVGDRVKANGYEGRLMPKTKASADDTVILKLESGYNIGVEVEEIKLIEKQESSQKSFESPEYDEEKPDVLVLHTGGTIASRVSYEEGGVKPAYEPEELIQMYPEAAEIANIHSEVIAQMLSEDMEPTHWQEIAEKVDDVKDNYDGIIIGHGTDTMSYTGAALTLMLQNIDAGVLLVGSQRSSDRPSSDAATNMYAATKFLTETEYRGIGICMHQTSDDKKCNILPAAKARKMHTSRRDAFKPINTKAIATIDVQKDKIRFSEDNKETEGEYKKETSLETDVGYLKVRPGMKVEEIEQIKERNYSGLIIEGTGLGHMPVNSFDDKTQHHKKILQTISEMAEETTIVMASQCVNGRINMNVYNAGHKIQEAGVVSAQDMHPELAYVKLMWSLGNSENMQEAKKKFKTNINGEKKPRTPYS